MLSAIAAVSQLPRTAPYDAVAGNISSVLGRWRSSVASVLAGEGPKDTVLAAYRDAMNLPPLIPVSPPTSGSADSLSRAQVAGIATGASVAGLLLVLLAGTALLLHQGCLARAGLLSRSHKPYGPPQAGQLATVLGK